MNVIFIPKNRLKILTMQEVKMTDCSHFFSSHKHSVIFVMDGNEDLKGYITHALYKKCGGNDGLQPLTFEVVLEKKDIPGRDIQEYLSSANDLEAIPVLDGKIMIGAFVKTYPEELIAFDRIMNLEALNILRCFVNELTDYFKKEKIQCVYMLNIGSDFSEIKNIIGRIIPVTTILLNPEGSLNTTSVSYNCHLPSTGLIIDTLYSRSYRELYTKTNLRILSLEDLMIRILTPVVKKYCEDYGVYIHMYIGPTADRIKNSESHRAIGDRRNSFNSALSSKKICKIFSAGDEYEFNYLTASESGLLDDGNYVVTNGLKLEMAIPNRGKDLPIGNAVYFYGPCITYGLCVPQEYSIPSLIEKMIAGTGYGVVNNGIKNGHSLLNDFLYILDTPFRRGDHIVIINAFDDSIRKIMESYFNLNDLSLPLEQNDEKPWFFIDNVFHINHIANQILARTIVKSFNLPMDRQANSEINKNYFEQNELLKDTNPRLILERGLLGSYKEYLSSHKRDKREQSTIGAVLITANPITLGHEYLINYAKKHCDVLYVFVVEEDLFFFKTAERMMLVHEVLSDPDIIIVSTGNMMTAKFTFPEYFSRGEINQKFSKNDIPDFHCKIFGEFVCPILGITKRFIAEECHDSVTNAYNDKLEAILPKYGVEVIKIPRLRTKNNCIISSSIVRKSIINQDFERLSEFVSQPVKEYIESKWKR